MLRIGFSLLIGVAGMAAWAPAALAAPPQVFSGWTKITYTQDVCMQRAATDLQNNGFVGGGTGTKGTGTTYFGYNGDYTAIVRCAAAPTDPGIVYFIVAGPPSDLTSDYEAALKNGF